MSLRQLQGVVLDRRAGGIRFHPRLVEFAAHHLFHPAPPPLDEEGPPSRRPRHRWACTFASATLVSMGTGLLAMACVIGAHAVAALASGRSSWRRSIGLVLASPGLLAPLVAEEPAWRGILGFASTLYFMRAIDLFRDRRERAGWERVWFVLNVPHLDRMARSSKTLKVWMGLSGLACAGVCAFGLWSITSSISGQGEVAYLASRWLLAFGCAYAFMEALDRLVRAGWHAAGWECEPGMVAPGRSRSFSEFWGKRWNMEVSTWLSRNCFRPLARVRRPGLGLFAAFAASALIHIYPTWMAVGPLWAGIMGTFFLIHGGLVLLERPLGVDRWPRPLGHIWVLILMAGTAPLALEPLLLMFGMPPDSPALQAISAALP